MSAITELRQIDLHSGYITKPRWSPDGRFLAIPTQSGSIPIFDLDTGEVARTLGSHSAEVTAVTWNRNSDFILTSSLDRSIGLWELNSGRREAVTLSGHNEPVHSVEWTDEEAFAMTCSADRVRAWDGCCLLPGWTEEMERAANRYTSFTAAACSFGTTFLLAMVAEHGTLLLLTSLLSADLLECVRMNGGVQSLAWSPAEQLLAVATGARILLLRATQEGFESSGRELTTHGPDVDALAFAGDGTLLALRDAEGLKIWDVEGARLTAALHEIDERVSNGLPASGIAFHPTRPLVAASTSDGTAFRILEVST